ncbi:MAG: sugar phosphate isomerase/epimerase [Selenomonadaceae bacterium]|nr:sugar phosphate isomerase/epimerase [Selenomonadaceae bacterium]
MLKIGVQTQNAIDDNCPEVGFNMIHNAGFDCVDFSLHSYLSNTDIYRNKCSELFDKSMADLERYFAPHKSAAKAAGITVHQMHMPYPMYSMEADKAFNDYLSKNVAYKSLAICAFLECRYIVIHGFNLTRYLGTEENEWQYTENFIDKLAPQLKELGITACIENIYSSIGGHLIEGSCCNARKAAERIDRLNDKYQAEILGFCFDTGHANLLGLDFERFITDLGDRLKILHIHDNDGIRDLHQIPFTFSRSRENCTSTDWTGFIKGLRNVGFEGVLNFETGPVLNSFPIELKRDALDMIAKIGKYFSNEITKE